jgi:hypothetical protein
MRKDERRGKKRIKEFKEEGEERRGKERTKKGFVWGAVMGTRFNTGVEGCSLLPRARRRGVSYGATPLCIALLNRKKTQHTKRGAPGIEPVAAWRRAQLYQRPP